jgi:hypothetical protein
MYEHVHAMHKPAVAALKQIAKERDLPYKQVQRLFVRKNNEEVTDRFWELIWKEHGEHYRYVYFCPDCRKFTVE